MFLKKNVSGQFSTTVFCVLMYVLKFVFSAYHWARVFIAYIHVGFCHTVHVTSKMKQVFSAGQTDGHSCLPTFITFIIVYHSIAAVWDLILRNQSVDSLTVNRHNMKA